MRLTNYLCKNNRLYYFFDGIFGLKRYAVVISYNVLDFTAVSFVAYEIADIDVWKRVNINKFSDFILRFIKEKNIKVVVLEERFKYFDKFLIETDKDLFIYEME